jgi:anti-sigma B factor antagonist
MQAASVIVDGSGDLLVTLRGDLDFTSSADVLRLIREQVAGAPTAVIRVDLAEVAFMDSSGIGVLVQLLHLAEERGAQVRLERPGPKVLDQMHMAGLSELFGLPGEPAGWVATPVEDRG